MVNLVLSGLCSAFLPATITTGLVVNPDGKNDSCCQEKIMYVNRQFRQGSKFYFFCRILFSWFSSLRLCRRSLLFINVVDSIETVVI